MTSDVALETDCPPWGGLIRKSTNGIPEMTRLRLAGVLMAAWCWCVSACGPIYYIGTVGLMAPDGGGAGTDGGLEPCVDVGACGCGDFCGSTGLDGGVCMGRFSDSCMSDFECADDGAGARCLLPVDGQSACSRSRCYPQAPGSASCASDADCPCTSACARLDGGTPGCVPLTVQTCTPGGACGDGGICISVYRNGGVCGGVCRPPDW
jgi:hypothetical protein